MSQAEIVKSPIISVVFSPNDKAKNNGNSAPSAASNGRPVEAITTFAWSGAPVSLLEEVELPKHLDPRLVTLRAPGSAQARSYRLLQHRLFAKGDPHVIAVTSAETGEGKTTCAANLALVLSEASLSRVLLVDANLTRPGLADLFGFEPADSFMIKLLRSEDASPPHAVATIADLGLQLAALEPKPLPGKRIDRLLLSEALRSLRSAYDYIVIDAGSVLESADVNSVSECADGVVVAARAGKSRRGRLQQAIRQLEPATVVGTVLIDT